MGTHSLTSATAAGITLSSNGSYLTPFTVASTGTIDTANKSGIYSAIAATVTNDGTIIGNAFGISLAAGGSIYNTGLISTNNAAHAAQYGIYAGGYVTVDNTGQITGSGYALELAGGGFVSNSGTITATDGLRLLQSGTVVNTSSGLIDGVVLNASGAVLNAGQIIANDAAVLRDGGYLSNASTGTITGTTGAGYGVYIGAGGAMIINAGTISGGYFGVRDVYYKYASAPGSTLATVDIQNSGLIESDASTAIEIGFSTGVETIQNSGTIASGQGNAGFAVEVTSAALQLVVDSGAVFAGTVSADAAYANLLELASSTTAGTIAGIGSSFTGFESIAIDANAAWVLSGDSAGLANHEVITGFDSTDTIELTGFSASSFYFADNVLTLSNSGATEYLAISEPGSMTTADFTIHSSDLGTEITDDVPCFCAGTGIATPHGDVPVEALQIGDIVKTLHAGLQKIKWIGTRSYAAPFTNHFKVLPICIKPGAIADNVPAQPLWVSPGHAICIDGALIHASRLVNGVSVVQAAHVESVTYYHIELENHEVIFAENCPAETFRDEHFRAQFTNRASFHTLYPEHIVSQTACLPYLVHGFTLHAIQQRLASRAGIAMAEGPASLRGYVDQAGPELCYGWAQDMLAPGMSVCLDIFEEDHRIGRVLANLYRADLQSAGIGDGCHGFEFLLPPGTGRVEVRHAVDGVVLALTDAAIRAAA